MSESMVGAPFTSPGGRRGRVHALAPASQVEAVASLDKALRKEMAEAQADMCRWITEIKQTADTAMLQAQRTLDADKGLHAARSPSAARALRAQSRPLVPCLCSLRSAATPVTRGPPAATENIALLQDELDSVDAADEALQQRECLALRPPHTRP